MERIVTQAAHRIGIAVALVFLLQSGPGCARMRKYRAQDSPMPGMPLIGRVKRGSTEAPASQARVARTRNRGDVAWSGLPNTAPPLARLDPPQGLNPDSVSMIPSLAKSDSSPASSIESPKTTKNPDIAKVRDLVQTGRTRLEKLRSYQVAMNRQERVGDTLQPSEEVLLSIWRDPKAVRLEWPTGPHKGREVLYSAAASGGMMHINMADSILPIPKMTLPPDSPLVMKNSRHPITEAGLDAILARLDETLKPHEAGTAAGERLSYDGTLNPPEIGRPCHKVSRVTATGETWIIYLDSATCVPTFVQEVAANGDLLERYVFHDFVADPASLAEASAFDPEKRWNSGRGFFGRIAQSGSANPAPK